MVPVTKYARSGEANIAYQVIGDGPVDLVFCPGFISHIEHFWEEPGTARYLERLASFSRLILVDRRGTGLSDPILGNVTLEQEADDLLAVLDAAGSERPALLGYTSGGPLIAQFAATYPERVSALIFYACIARAVSAPDYDWALTPEERQAAFDELLSHWGEGANIDVIAPSRAGDERLRSWMARLERLSASPGAIRALSRSFAEADVREILPTLNVPTLVMHRIGDRLIDIRHSRYLAEHIPGAKLVEFPGDDSLASVGDTESIVGEIEEFLTGGRHGAALERALLTVLFTDIVDATNHASRMGDKSWRDLLASHDAAIRKEIERFEGDEVKTIGDAFLVTFEGAPSRALRCAQAIVRAVEGLGIKVRVGLHTGECEIIGDDVGGMAVHIAARVGAMAEPGEVLMSGTVFGTVVGAGFHFEERGMRQLKGVPGKWPLFALSA